MQNTYIQFQCEPETATRATEPQLQFINKLWRQHRAIHADVLAHTTNFADEQLGELVQTVNPALDLGKRTFHVQPESLAFQTALNKAILDRYVGTLTPELFNKLDKNAASYLINALKMGLGELLSESLLHFGFEEQQGEFVGLVSFPRFDLDAPANAELRALVLEIARSLFGTPEPTPEPETAPEIAKSADAQPAEVRAPESDDLGARAPVAPSQMMEVYVPFCAVGNCLQASLRVKWFCVDTSKLSETGRAIADKLAKRHRGYSVRETYNPRHEFEEKLRAYSPDQREGAERVYGPSYPDTERARTRSVLFPFPPCINIETGRGRSYGEIGEIAPGFDVYAYIEAHAQNRTPDQISDYRP